MKPKLDQFFDDRDFGRIKLVGYENDDYLFNSYDFLDGKVIQRQKTYKIPPRVFEAKVLAGIIKPSVTPA